MSKDVREAVDFEISNSGLLGLTKVESSISLSVVEEES